LLTLDEPDSTMPEGPGLWLGLDGDGLLPVEHLFMTVRASCEHAPFDLVPGDPDWLYHTHGDPRD